MSVKLLTQHHLEFLSLKGGFTGLSESTLVKMPHCWKSLAYADPESFARGGPTLTGSKYHNMRANIGPPAKRHLNGVLMMAQH